VSQERTFCGLRALAALLDVVGGSDKMHDGRGKQTRRDALIMSRDIVTLQR
jgi:hypothetical protein